MIYYLTVCTLHKKSAYKVCQFGCGLPYDINGPMAAMLSVAHLIFKSVIFEKFSHMFRCQLLGRNSWWSTINCGHPAKFCKSCVIEGNI